MKADHSKQNIGTIVQSNESIVLQEMEQFRLQPWTNQDCQRANFRFSRSPTIKRGLRPSIQNPWQDSQATQSLSITFIARRKRLCRRNTLDHNTVSSEVQLSWTSLIAPKKSMNSGLLCETSALQHVWSISVRLHLNAACSPMAGSLKVRDCRREPWAVTSNHKRDPRSHLTH